MSEHDQDPRTDLVSHLREQIAEGNYMTDGKLRAAADGIVGALRHPPQVNVWELLTHRGRCRERGPEAQRADQSVERLLGGTGRFAGQEIELAPVLDDHQGPGWRLTVFSCHDRGEEGAQEIRIYVPQRGHPRVELWETRDGEWRHKA